MPKPQLRKVKLFWSRGGEKPGTGFCVGTASFKEECDGFGWRFYPNVSGHNSSRKLWPTWEKCIPRWTGGLDDTTSTGFYRDENGDWWVMNNDLELERS